MRRIKNDRCGQKGGGMWEERAAEKEYLCLSLGILVLFAVSAVSLKALTRAQSGSPREMLSVPLQQMARVWVHEENGDLMEDQSLRQEMEKYMPSEWGFSVYNPHLADRVKNIAIIHDDPKGLFNPFQPLFKFFLLHRVRFCQCIGRTGIT